MWTRWIWPRAASPWIGSPITDRGRAGAMRFDVITLFPELIAQLQGQVGAFTFGTERIDAELLAACPAAMNLCLPVAATKTRH